ncbi:cyclin-I-like isoform X1 [Myxocyprinus asiaticus]|uniref:cyclin-I-like isoform X1 n=1 Tax=Myxocyprinus asiaticus TaxID=70543 RepID=UPI002221D802|nr:cyclin-I-like isoform X1 [Myxocyprinus asiaticus]
MKPPGEDENRRLGTLLLNTLEREMRLWRAPVLKNGCIQITILLRNYPLKCTKSKNLGSSEALTMEGSDISPSQYQEVIVWMHEMSCIFQFCSETFALGVCVLNRLLATVKTQLKYLKCMAITSLILAAKINEEDEARHTSVFIELSLGFRVLNVEVNYCRVHLDSGNWKTTANMIFADPFNPTAKEKIHLCFHDLLQEGKK